MKTASRYCIFVLLFSIPLAIWNATLTAIEIKDLIAAVGAVVLVVFGLLYVLRKDTIRIPRGWVPLLVAAYGAVMVLSLSRTNRCSINYDMLGPHLSGVIMFIVAIRLFSSKHLMKAVWVMIAAATVACLYALMQYTRLDPLMWALADGKRDVVTSTFGNKNYFGSYLLLIIPLSAFAVTTVKDTLPKAMAAAVTLFMIVALYLTRSRAALAAFGVTVLVYGIVRAIRVMRNGTGAFKALWLPVGALLLACVGIMLAPKEIREDFFNLSKGWELEWRMSYYKGAWEKGMEQPYLGRGPGTFISEFPTVERHRGHTKDPNVVAKHVHNEYLETWFEHGLPGIGLLLAILVGLGIVMSKAFDKAESGQTKMFIACAAVALTGYLLHGVVTVATRHTSSAFNFWVLAALVYRSAKDTTGAKEPWMVPNSVKKGGVAFAAATVIVLCGGISSVWAIGKNYVSDMHAKTAYDMCLRGQFRQARDLLDRAIELQPKSVEAYYERGYANFSLGDMNNAGADYEHVHKLAPNYMNVLFNIGSVYYRKHDWVRCGHWSRLSFEQYPHYQPAALMVAHCYYYGGVPDGALHFVNALLDLNEKHPKGLELKEQVVQILSRR